MVDAILSAVVALFGGVALRRLLRRLPPEKAPCELAALSLALFWTSLASCWSYFWWMDLRHAMFQLTLLLVPLAAGLAVVVGVLWDIRAPLAPPCSKRDLAALATLVTASFLWSALAVRADNGCTGVSRAYGHALLVTLILVFGCGPSVAASHVARLRARARGCDASPSRG